MGLEDDYQSGTDEAAALRAREQQEIDDARHKVQPFAESAGSAIRGLLTLDEAGIPSIGFPETVIRRSRGKLRATARPFGEVVSGRFKIAVRAEVWYQIEEAPFAPIEGLDTKGAVECSVSIGDGPPRTFSIPCSCNHVTPHFQVNKATFDESLRQAVKHLGTLDVSP